MVCIRVGSDKGAGLVLAAAGRYAELINQPLSAVPDQSAREILERCLLERSNQCGERSLVLYFAGRHGNFAVYIESTVAIRNIDRHLLNVFRTNIAICGENIGLVERLRTAAYVDTLTSLPNRAAQIDAIDELAKGASHRNHVLALIDIDQFSETIDAFGYRFGDQQIAGGR